MISTTAIGNLLNPRDSSRSGNIIAALPLLYDVLPVIFPLRVTGVPIRNPATAAAAVASVARGQEHPMRLFEALAATPETTQDRDGVMLHVEHDVTDGVRK